MLQEDFIYLASQSPRRHDLLEKIGVRHELLVAGDDEDAEALEAEHPREPAARYVQRVTRLKLEAAILRRERRQLPPAPILCADTTVTLDRLILGKPASDDDAFRILQMLQGRTHRVLTAVALAASTEPGRMAVRMRLSVSRVTVAPMSPAAIRRYVSSGEPQGKAGAYAIQGRMAAHVRRLSGSYTGVMGLPLFETAELLTAAGVAFG